MKTLLSLKGLLSTLLLLLFLLASTPLTAVAVVLKQHQLTGPLVLQFQQALSYQSAVGSRAEAVVAARSCHQGHCIPQGTRLVGILRTVKASRLFHRPGYIDWQLKEVRYPGGQVVRYAGNPRKAKVRLQCANAYTVKKQLLEEVPSVLGATAVVVPLALASSLTAGAIIPLGFAGALIASSLQEGIQWRRGKAHGGFLTHTGRAVTRSTLVPYVAYNASKRSPNVMLARGQKVALKPSRGLAKALYRLS
jgi:hypothetical protein